MTGRHQRLWHCSLRMLVPAFLDLEDGFKLEFVVFALAALDLKRRLEDWKELLLVNVRQGPQAGSEHPERVGNHFLDPSELRMGFTFEACDELAQSSGVGLAYYISISG